MDLSRAAAISDMRPNRLAVIGGILQASAPPSISAATVHEASTYDLVILSTQEMLDSSARLVSDGVVMFACLPHITNL